MSSPGQKRGGCGHIMASFNSHSFCAQCRDEGKEKDPCVEQPDTTECKFCNLLVPDQCLQLATPSYKCKTEKREAKKLEVSSTPTKDSYTLVDPSSVSVIGAVDEQGSVKSPTPFAPPEKKSKKEKPTTSKAMKSVKSKATTDTKIAELDQKWPDRFNRLEALLMARTFEPTFSSNVKVTPTHSPPASVVQVTEPFIRPAQPASNSLTEFPGTGSSAVKQQPTSKTYTSRPTLSTEFPETGSSAIKHQPTSKTQNSRLTSSEHTGTNSSTSKHQSTSKLKSSRPHTDRPSTGSNSSAFKHQSASKLQPSQHLTD